MAECAYQTTSSSASALLCSMSTGCQSLLTLRLVFVAATDDKRVQLEQRAIVETVDVKLDLFALVLSRIGVSEHKGRRESGRERNALPTSLA